MNFTASFLALLAAAQSIAAFPFGGSHSDDLVAPVPVTQLVCDGDTYKCTASLDFGDGHWVADWNTAVFHTGLFGGIDHKETIARMAMAPVPVTALNCDGDTYKCTANLKFGDGRWVAQWSANVFHTFAPSVEEPNFAPVPVTKLTCDGDTYKCTANLQFGDNRWVAQWGSNVYHTGFTATSERPSFLKQ